MSELHLAWIFVPAIVILASLCVFLLRANLALDESRLEAVAYAEDARGEMRKAQRTLVRLATARPGRNAERERLALSFNRTAVVRAGAKALIEGFQQYDAVDRMADADKLAREMSVYMHGEANLLYVVPKILEAASDAILDLDLEAASIKAEIALERGDLDEGDQDEGIRRIPVRTLDDIAKESRNFGFGDLTDTSKLGATGAEGAAAIGKAADKLKKPVDARIPVRLENNGEAAVMPTRIRIDEDGLWILEKDLPGGGMAKEAGLSDMDFADRGFDPDFFRKVMGQGAKGATIDPFLVDQAKPTKH